MDGFPTKTIPVQTKRGQGRSTETANIDEKKAKNRLTQGIILFTDCRSQGFLSQEKEYDIHAAFKTSPFNPFTCHPIKRVCALVLKHCPTNAREC